MSIIAPNATPRVTALANGLKVATIPVASELTGLGIWLKSGSFYETAANSGAAHFLEHILFRGNSVYPNDRLEEMSEKTGINLQAATGRTVTRFSARVEAKHIPQAIDAIAQTVLNPEITDEAVENEKPTIIEEERTVARDIYETIWDVLHAHSFPNSPIGFPILGNRKTILGMTAKVLREYHARFFNPSNCYFVCATKVEHERVVEWVERSTSFLKKREPLDIDAIDRAVPARFEPTAQMFGSKVLDQSWCAMGYEAPPISSPHYVPGQMIRSVIGNLDGQSPFEKPFLLNSLVISRFNSIYMPYNTTGFMGFVLQCNPGREPEAVTEVAKAIQGATVGLRDDDMPMARLRVMDTLTKNLTSISTVADELGSCLLLQKKWISPAQWSQILSGVKKDNLVEYAHKYFGGKNPSCVFFLHEDTYKQFVAGQQAEANRQHEEMRRLQEERIKHQQSQQRQPSKIVRPWDEPAKKPSGIIRP